MFVPAVKLSTVRLSCHWCMYMERFTLEHYLLTVAAYMLAMTKNALIWFVVPLPYILTVQTVPTIFALWSLK